MANTEQPTDSERIRGLFDAGADKYDRARRQLLPQIDEIYQCVVDAVAEAVDTTGAATEKNLSIADLGAGTGLLSQAVYQAIRPNNLLLVDLSESMLDVARRRFENAGGPTTLRYRCANYARDALPGNFHAIVSAFSIHHLSDSDKQVLYRRVFEALAPGAVFVNADQVLGETAEIEHRWQREWVADARQAGVSESDLAASLERQQADRHARLADQLGWTRNAGFVDVACRRQFGRFAVMTARRPAGRNRS